MDKKFFIALTLSMLTVLGLQYYFSGKVNDPQKSNVASTSQQPVVGQPIKVAAVSDLYRPLNMDVNFEKKKLDRDEILTDVETSSYKAVFSNNGAVLTSLEFKDYKGKNGALLRTLEPAPKDDSSSQECFLLALENETPYQYELLYKQDKKIEQSDIVEVAYKAETEHWSIQKTYVIYKDSYKVDLNINFEPKGQNVDALRARIFVKAPYVNEIDNDPVGGFVLNEAKASVEKVDLNTTQDLIWHWGTPKILFGVDDRYFVHGIVNDPAKFVQRAYFKKNDAKNVLQILEGTEIKESSKFNLSFYMGPKILDAMSDVDVRLTELLSFGWLSWLCKLLLKLIEWLVLLLGNYGWAIVAMTILLRLPFMPLSIYSRRKMEEYQKYQPTIQRIRQKYRNDIKLQNQELVKFHQDHNLSTVTPLLGCLPLLIQMPILFALYRVLGNYLGLYQAPFFWWISDLSAKDPYYVIPIIMGLTMLWQQVITPSSDEKQKVMMYFISIVMTVVFAGFPVGLVLYWTVNNVFTLFEDYFRKYALKNKTGF
jgi:YidC/Oxa1 family membrane protein insertase